MYKKQNLHVHSHFCDGKDAPDDMIKQAIALGFDSLGFSMHSYLSCSYYGVVTPEKIENYKKEILRLKKVYKGVFDVFLGMEYDIYSDNSADGYEYLIASVHYLKTKEGRKTFDIGLKETLDYINDYYDGDAMKFAKAYYEAVATTPEYGKFDIIGHFDLITKTNEMGKFLDTDSKEYKDLGFEAIHALKGKLPLFEVNTGAVARGYRTTPYPQMDFLKEFQRNGFGAVITSDCHDRNYLDCFYDESRELLREAGFKSKFVFTSNGFEEVAL